MDWRWILGAIGGAFAVIVPWIVALLVLSFRLGKRAADAQNVANIVTEVRDAMKRFAEQMTEFMKKSNSDITELKERTAALEARDEMRSAPSFHGED